MPMMMPALEDLAKIPRHKREKIRRAVIRILTEVDAVALRESQMTYRDLVMGEARALEATTPHDPPHVTAARRQALLEAIR